MTCSCLITTAIIFAAAFAIDKRYMYIVEVVMVMGHIPSAQLKLHIHPSLREESGLAKLRPFTWQWQG